MRFMTTRGRAPSPRAVPRVSDTEDGTGLAGTAGGLWELTQRLKIHVSLAPSETKIQQRLRISPEATPEIMRNPQCKRKTG